MGTLALISVVILSPGINQLPSNNCLQKPFSAIQKTNSEILVVEPNGVGLSYSPVEIFRYNSLLSSFVSWATIISGYTRSGDYSKVFDLLDEMWKEGLRPNEFAIGSLTMPSSGLKDVCIGRQLHGWWICSGYVIDVYVETSLVCLFSCMVLTGSVAPTNFTYASMISACTNAQEEMYGKIIHGMVIKNGKFDDTMMDNSLVTFYAKCGKLQDANRVFEGIRTTSVVSWNSIIAGNEQNGEEEAANNLFHRMIDVLSSVSKLSDLNLGKEIHARLMKSFLEPKTSISNSLITMYSKCKEVGKAKRCLQLFKKMPLLGVKQDDHTYTAILVAVSSLPRYNAMMDGYSINGRLEDSIKIFLDRQEKNLSFDYLTFSIVLTTCGRLVSFNLGKQFHALTVKSISGCGKIHPNHLMSIKNSLISMCSKCGSISDAALLFSRMRRIDAFSWTAMITGYAHHGMAYESLDCFDRMQQDGLKPNSVTFLGLLTACSHAGLIKEGLHYFSSMNCYHNLNPSIEHYACMVDLFRRAGHFEQALEFVRSGSTQFFRNWWMLEFVEGVTLGLPCSSTTRASCYRRA
ncbi:hypothetical protein MKW92_009547 [Papaver armeniacum]|nr:hypothetical protein MKW92_009547 [Papaver armeniacum]